MLYAADRIAELEQQLAEARKEIDEQCRLNAMGQERELRLIAQLAEVRRYAERYQWLRSRDLDAVETGGIFCGMTPENIVLNGDDLDEAIDDAIAEQEQK